MKTLYLIVTVVICISIILFVFAFFYIDTNRHTTYCYNIYNNRQAVANVKLDKYNTEDKIVYKSETYTPFSSVSTKHKRNLSIQKKGMKVASYDKKHLSEGVSMNIYLRCVDSTADFLAVGHSDFAYARRLPVDKDTIIFEKEALITYFNLIDKYDFKKGGSQTLSALTHTYTFLPPHKSNIEISPLKDEIIKVDGKKMKAQGLKITLPDRSKVSLWLNRWTHIPLLIEDRKAGFEAAYSDTPADIAVKSYTVSNTAYDQRSVTFKNKKIALSGTLSIPAGEGPFPALILIGGPGPQDREALGMFTNLADSLAQNGTASLRFDKRGVAKSEGDFSTFTGEDMASDIQSSIEFLLGQKEIDTERIGILGHSEGGYYAAYAAATNPDISGCIITSGVEAANLPDTSLERIWDFDKSATSWDKEYMNYIAKSAKDTAEILQSGKDWALLLHKRIFLKKRRLDLERKPLDIIRKIKVPTLILRGKRDTVIPAELISLLEESLSKGGTENYKVLYFNKLNHFLGEKIEDGIHRTHLSMDKEVIDRIIEWVAKNMIPPPPPAEPAADILTIEEKGVPIIDKPEDVLYEIRDDTQPEEDAVIIKGAL